MTTGCLASASLRTGWRYVYLCICPFCIWNANFVFWQVTCWILYSFLFRFALGHGTPSWRSGTKQEDFEFPKKIQLVTQFSAAIGTDTKFHDLKKRYSENCRIQIWNDDSFKSGKAAFSKTCQIARLWVRLPGSVCFGWNDFDTYCGGFWGSKRSFVSQDLIRTRAQNRFEFPTFETNSGWGRPIQSDESSAWKPKSKIISVVSN